MCWNKDDDDVFEQRETLIIDAPAENGVRDDDLAAFFVFSSLGVVYVVYVERQSPDVSIISRPKPAEDERKEASESFFLRLLFLGFHMLTFFSRHFVMMMLMMMMMMIDL